MSGSSGGGGIPSINRPDEKDDCLELVIKTNLSTPLAPVISNLKTGDILSIHAVSDQGPIQALTKDGDLAGSIISREQVRLLSCINKGTTFIAEVLSVKNGQCQVQISAE